MTDDDFELQVLKARLQSQLGVKVHVELRDGVVYVSIPEEDEETTIDAPEDEE